MGKWSEEDEGQETRHAWPLTERPPGAKCCSVFAKVVSVHPLGDLTGLVFSFSISQ